MVEILKNGRFTWSWRRPLRDSRPLMITDPLWKIGKRKCVGLNVSYCLQCPTLGHLLCFLNDTWWTSFKNRQNLCSSSMFKMQIAVVFQLTLSHQWLMSALKGQNNKKKCCLMEKEWETPFRTQDIFYPSFWPQLYLYCKLAEAKITADSCRVGVGQSVGNLCVYLWVCLPEKSCQGDRKPTWPMKNTYRDKVWGLKIMCALINRIRSQNSAICSFLQQIILPHLQ